MEEYPGINQPLIQTDFVWTFPYRRNEIEMNIDTYTNDYFKQIEKRIGLISIDSVWKEQLMIIDYKFPLFWNEKGSGIAHVGKQRDGKWLAQIGIQIKDTYQNIARYQYKNCPTSENILETNLLNQIYAYFRMYGKEYTTLTCCNCNRKFHWLEEIVPLKEQLERLKYRYCGCNEER